MKKRKNTVIITACLLILLFIAIFNSETVRGYRWSTGLVVAISEGDEEEVKDYLEVENMDINRKGNVFIQFIFGSETSSATPIEAAVEGANLKIINEVLEYPNIVPQGENINLVNWILNYVNHGTWKERHEIVEKMLDKGLDVDYQYMAEDYNAEEQLPTLCAIASESLLEENSLGNCEAKGKGICKLYKKASSLSKIKKVSDPYGLTPMHCAVGAGNVELTNYLIGREGYSINDRNVNGETPLIYLMKYCYTSDTNIDILVEIIEYVLNQGADLEISDKEGKTAYDYARLLCNERVMELLDDC